MTNSDTPRLTFFRSDSGITISFGEHIHFIDEKEPFHNIALKAIEQDDYVPFYVEMAKREGKGEEFAKALREEIDRVLSEET